MAKLTINEALSWKKTLAERHGELVPAKARKSR